MARVESFLHLYDLLRAYRACAIAPDLRPLQPFPADVLAWLTRGVTTGMTGTLPTIPSLG